MALSLRRGTVTAIAEEHEGLVRCEVDGEACVAFPALTGAVALGDEVVVNVQGRELGLGSGGFDVLHVNLTRGLDLAAPRCAHVMKLPYTPVQHAVRHAEEDGPVADVLGGLPVVCCSLHSQVAPVCAALAGTRVAYVQVAGGALPLRLSDTLRALQGHALIATTVSAGAGSMWRSGARRARAARSSTWAAVRMRRRGSSVWGSRPARSRGPWSGERCGGAVETIGGMKPDESRRVFEGRRISVDVER